MQTVAHLNKSLVRLIRKKLFFVTDFLHLKLVVEQVSPIVFIFYANPNLLCTSIPYTIMGNLNNPNLLSYVHVYVKYI
jgi:hypothetical protein